MLPEQENQLFEDIGEIKASIKSLNHLLDAHTTQDMTQFTAMTEAVNVVNVNVSKMITDLAVSDAVRVANEKHVSTITNRRASIVGSMAGFSASAVLSWIRRA